MDDPKVLAYVTYLLASGVLVVWVARTLFRNGRPFLLEVFAGNAEMADSVNRLLVVGFYLVNLGYISLTMRSADQVPDLVTALELLSGKLGSVMLILGGMHFFNLFCFNRLRHHYVRRAVEQAA